MFKINKKRNDQAPIESKPSQAKEEESQLGKRKAAWVDNSVSNLKVNINGKSRLRKLMKTEGEEDLDGNEYQERL